MRIWDVELGAVRQVDGVTCGPTAAMVAGALLDPAYAATLCGTAHIVAEQRRIHAAMNRFWPRRLGTTPWGIARAISTHSNHVGVRYGVRAVRRQDALSDAIAALDGGWPIAVLIGNLVPRHWVLLTERTDDVKLRRYDPSSGRITATCLDEMRAATTFPRLFAIVLPTSAVP